MEPIFELAITLPARGSRERSRALHQQLRAAIVEGRLKPGLRLPPTRSLAAAYGVSRNTAVMTYDLLLSEGYLSTRRGAGTYVATSLPQPPDRKSASINAAPDRRINAVWRGLQPWAGPVTQTLQANFRLGVPETSEFPFDVWRRLNARAVRAMTHTQVTYQDPQGQAELREAIARHVSVARAVACRAEDIIVTSGAQQAFDLLARVLVTPGRTVIALEDPGYPRVRAVFAAAGAKIVPVPVDEDGLIVDRLPRQARIICVTPSHQFPLGTAMSMRRRAALLEFAQARGSVVIEDDFDGEFRYGGRPLDALQTLDRAESVFYVGTFSKSLFPMIRLGFVVCPSWAQSTVVMAKSFSDCHCPVLSQSTLAAFIAEGHMARHVRKMRQVYGERREILLRGLQQDFDRWLAPVPSSAGLHMAAFAKGSFDARAFSERALEVGVRVPSVHQYYAGQQGKQGLAFGYGAIDAAGIRTGLASLRRLLRSRRGD
jgi:GntR family transcriptional regulator / MocR family aminotransferase